MLLLCPRVGSNLHKCPYEARKIFERPLVALGQSFVVDHQFCSVPFNRLSRECWFSNCSESSLAHLCWTQLWAVVVCKWFQNQSCIYVIQYPACNYWKYCSVLMFWDFSEGEAENYWSVTRCHLKVLRCVHESSSFTEELHGHRLRTIISKEDRAFRCIMRRQSFLSASRIRVELTRRTGQGVFVRRFL